MRPACARFSDRLRIGVAFALSLLVHVFVAFIAPGVLRPMRPTVLPATLAVELLVSTGEVPPAPSAELAETEFGVPTGPPQKLHARAVQPKLERSSASSGPADRPDPTYYGARDLDVYPTLTAALELQHPAAAHVGGRVLLVLLIDAQGAVDDVQVIESEPPGIFEEPARRALATARFKPARKSGRAVKSRLLVALDFASGNGPDR